MADEDKAVHRTSKGTGLLADDRILAKLAIKQQIASRDQIGQALVFQLKERKKGHQTSLGQVLLDQGIISPRQLKALQLTSAYLAKREPDRAFGQAAVRSGLVSQMQVEAALKDQARLYKETGSYRPLGDLLIEAGLLSARQREALNAALERLKHKSPPPEAVPADATEKWQPTGTVLFDAPSFDLVVTDDRMLVFARVKQPLPLEVTAESFTALCTSRGVTTGLLDSGSIDAALRADAPLPKLVRLAQGSAPQPGRPAEVHYRFERAASQGDDADEASPMSLKRWAEIPHVKRGACIAEKHPGIQGKDGVDVYGGTIPIEPVGEVKLLYGKGVTLSGDGLKALAAVDGRPHRSYFDRISVHPELTIEGDVSFETGNIDFDGDIAIGGVIQDGFRVKGATISAREISKAQVEASGDVLVQGGILGATIKAQGNVSAIHIHASRIESQGNVSVERGIVDSQLQISGKCLAPRGTLMASTIVARQGVEAYQVGSDRSGTCTLAVGVDQILDRQITELREASQGAEAEVSHLRETLNAQSSQMHDLELRIGGLAQVQDREVRERRELLVEIEEITRGGGPAQAAQVQSFADELTASIAGTEKEIEGLFAEQNRIKEAIARHRAQLQDQLDELQQIKDEISAIARWLTQNPAIASVKVFGTIHAGNIVQGNGTALTLSNDCRAVHIKESPLLSANGTPSGQRKLQVYHLR